MKRLLFTIGCSALLGCTDNSSCWYIQGDAPGSGKAKLATFRYPNWIYSPTFDSPQEAADFAVKQGYPICR